jgi:hypothetical protein
VLLGYAVALRLSAGPRASSALTGEPGSTEHADATAGVADDQTRRDAPSDDAPFALRG